MTTATLSAFLAAARIIAGPPMSICSTTSACPAPEATRLDEGIQVDDHQLERRVTELFELLDV